MAGDIQQKHIFVSYSRVDGVFAQQLAADLKHERLPVWIDVGGLTPGTPNWEQAIRDAIDHAVAVVLIASPASRQSAYVQGELAVARLRGCPVYPVWCDGAEWVDSIPLGMVNAQYVDCRDSGYSKGLVALIDSLKVFFEKPDRIAEIMLPTYDVARLDPSAFDQAQGLLNHLYMTYLTDWFPPLTYGSEWLLVNLDTRRIAVPWEWLTVSDLYQASLAHMNRSWAALSTENFGFLTGSRWAVWEARRVRAVGFVTNDHRLEQRLMTAYGSRELMLLLSDQCLKPLSPAEIDVRQFAAHRVMAVTGTSYNRVAFVPTGKDCL